MKLRRFQIRIENGVVDNCNPWIPNPGIGDVPIPRFQDYKNLSKLNFLER